MFGRGGANPGKRIVGPQNLFQATVDLFFPFGLGERFVERLPSMDFLNKEISGPVPGGWSWDMGQLGVPGFERFPGVVKAPRPEEKGEDKARESGSCFQSLTEDDTFRGMVSSESDQSENPGQHTADPSKIEGHFAQRKRDRARDPDQGSGKEWVQASGIHLFHSVGRVLGDPKKR
tara:strand:- start:146 stop:673 length:528 start_codon:yes stop_codon:yes gene_type:complete